jgi:hypothetical protein
MGESLFICDCGEPTSDYRAGTCSRCSDEDRETSAYCMDCINKAIEKYGEDGDSGWCRACDNCINSTDFLTPIDIALIGSDEEQEQEQNAELKEIDKLLLENERLKQKVNRLKLLNNFGSIYKLIAENAELKKKIKEIENNKRYRKK